MKKITSFFLICSGVDSEVLRKCPTETSKYVGMGATIFFTGLFAALAAGYALNMVFDNVWMAGILGLVWGLMIFNLDRYIVSSMRKEGKMSRELMAASPRIILAIIISIVIAKPLELKIFEKEINPELIVMEQEVYARQENLLKSRFQMTQDSLKSERAALRTAIESKAKTRDELLRIAQEEADGTGGSRRRNLGPIYKAKKADADKADLELQQLAQQHGIRIAEIEEALQKNDQAMNAELNAMVKSKLNGPAARLEALSRLTENSNAIAWANWFIILLFIAIETAPVLVKLISSKGPYDNLIRIEEHTFVALEVEEMAKTNAQVKERTSTFPQHERTFVSERLDTALKR
jgi:DNA-binding transcriptional MerR regulator